MKRELNILLWSLLGLSAAAQQPWSMNRCVAYAVEHATDVARRQLELRQRQADSRTAWLDFLPSVEAQVNGQYSWGRNINPETNTYNNVTTFNSYYQISASMLLFDGGRTLNAFRQARLAKTGASTAVERAQDERAVEVMAKYVDAVYTQRSIGLAEEKLRDSQALLKKTRRLFELGEKSRPDVVQLESQVAEDDYNLLHQQHAARKALLALKSAMNYPTADTLVLDDGLAEDGGQEAQHFHSGGGTAAVRMAEYSVENARLEWRVRRAELLPSLRLGGGFSTNYYKNLSEKGNLAPFGAQFHNNMGEYVYLTLSIPVFSPSTWRKARQAKTAYRLAQWEVADERRKLADAIAGAVMDRDGYAREVAQMGRKVASDSLAWHLSHRKYEEGMLSTFDLHTAGQTLLESRIRLLQMQMMLVLKQKLVDYYTKNQPLWTLK